MKLYMKINRRMNPTDEESQPPILALTGWSSRIDSSAHFLLDRGISERHPSYEES